MPPTKIKKTLKCIPGHRAVRVYLKSQQNPAEIMLGHDHTVCSYRPPEGMLNDFCTSKAFPQRFHILLICKVFFYAGRALEGP